MVKGVLPLRTRLCWRGPEAVLWWTGKWRRLCERWLLWLRWVLGMLALHESLCSIHVVEVAEECLFGNRSGRIEGPVAVAGAWVVRLALGIGSIAA